MLAIQAPEYEGFRRRTLLLTILVVAIGTVITVVFGTRHVVQGFLLGGFAAILHLYTLSRAVAKSGDLGAGLALSSWGRIAMVGGLFFIAIKRPDQFSVWATLLGYLTEKVGLLLGSLQPTFWPSKRGQ